MPTASSAARLKAEPDQIDLSFLSSDEDIVSFKKSAPKKGKSTETTRDARASNTGGRSSQRLSVRASTSAGISSPRTQQSSTAGGSARGRDLASRSRTKTRRGYRRDSFIEEDDVDGTAISDDPEEEEDSGDDDMDIDALIASMNGGGSSRNNSTRSDRVSQRNSKPYSQSRAHPQTQRPRRAAGSVKSGRGRPSPRTRPPLTNRSDESSISDAVDLSGDSDGLQQELDELHDSGSDSGGLTASTRRSARNANGSRGSESARAAHRTSRSLRTVLLGDEDEDEDDEDDFKERSKGKSRRSLATSKPRSRPRHQPEDEDDSEENPDWDDEAGSEDEVEGDQLVTSDDSDDRHMPAKRKKASAAKLASTAKRPRPNRAASADTARTRGSRTKPRRQVAAMRTRRTRRPRLRFSLQEELPEPYTGPPAYETAPIISIDNITRSAELGEVPFIDGVSPIYDLSESEEEQLQGIRVVSDNDSASDEAESYQEPEAAVDRHWPGCKRCTDGPTLPMYNNAMTTLKRNRKREANQRRKTPEHIDSRGRARKPLVDDWGKVSAIPQAEEWVEVLEDRGGWFECKSCSVSWHWGCLPTDTQKIILAAINTEQTMRHRSVFGESAPPPAPVRWIDIDQVVDMASCPDCTGYASYCVVCKADVHGVRTVAEQLGFTDAMLQQYPIPPATLTASKLFRCKRCSRALHYECLARERDDGDQTSEEAAKSVQEGGWLCSDCHTWPAVERILAWRQIDRNLWEDESALKASYAVLSPKENLPREYLVKFKGKSFRETSWVPHDWLRILHTQMLAQFLAKGSRLELEPAELIESTTAMSASARKNRASIALGGGRIPPSAPRHTRSVKKTLKVDEAGEVDVGPPGPMPDAQQRIPKTWKTPDRILAVKYFSSVQRGDDEEDVGGDVIEWDEVPLDKMDPSDYLRSWVHVSKLLIKWQDQPYEGSTWEDPPSRRKQADIFYEAQEVYRSFLVAQRITFPALTTEERRKKRERRLAKSGNSFRALDDQPRCIEGGDLIDFQLEGVNWLRYGWYNEKPGILADEMGLGKTVQIITFLASIWKEGKAGPFLVVVPNATLPNWMREFEKWMPQFRVVPYLGEVEARHMIAKYEMFHSKKTLAKVDQSIRPIKFHVVVASDTSVRINSLPLRKVAHWDVVIVDEGQNLKSGESVLLKRLNELYAEHRVIMTGTPLNNNVTELFNLLNWLEPGGQWKDIKALESEYSVLTPEVIEGLQKRLKPYFLRRLKKEVLDLPPKIELIIPTSLRPIQKRIYRSILESNIEDIQALAASRGDGSKKTKKTTIATLNNTLMQLRKCIQHPYLIAPDLETREDDANYEATWEHQRLIDASAKLSLLQRLLPKLKAQGHRILFFSQFVINLDIVEVFLRGEGYKYLRLDGNVGQKQRQKGIDAFNAPDSPYFIYMISTRAGGVGINLASADTVILMDPDWNPHVDMQAIARAHRIGQTKKLLVFSLMCKGTAEERIIEVAKRKMMLDHLIVQNLQREDERPDRLESILKFGAQALFAEGGTEESERDVRYTDEDLDALLRRREEDAGDDENEQGDGQAKGTFSYARIWETQQTAAKDDGIALTTVVDDDFWADLLQKHREDAAKREAEAAEKEVQEKRASRRDRIRAMLEQDEAVEDTERAVQVKRGRGRPPKVPKPVVDEDWATKAADESGSDDEGWAGVVREEDELLPAVQALRRRQGKSSKTAFGATSKTIQSVAATSAVPAGQVSAPSAPGVMQPASTSKSAHGTASASLSSAAAQKSTKPNLALFQRGLIAEHRLPSPSPLHDIDLSLPTAVVRPGHLATMRRVLLSLLPDSEFALEVAERSQLGVVPDLTPPHMRFQLTDTHIKYYMQLFGAPRELFEAAFSIISDDQVPAEILKLPHGGATALDLRKIREILLRAATYMVLALVQPKHRQPWTAAIEAWSKIQASRAAPPTVVEIADSPSAKPEELPPPTPMTALAAREVLQNQSCTEAWLRNISSRGDTELNKIAQLVALNRAAMVAPNLMLIVQNYFDGKGARPDLGPAKLSIRSSLPATVDFNDPDAMAPPTIAPAAVPAASASTSMPTDSPSRPKNRVLAALSRLSGSSGGSPTKHTVSKKDLEKLNLDVAVDYRKPRIKSLRSSISGSPRSSVGPSPSPAPSGPPGDNFAPFSALGGGTSIDGEETFDTPREQTCIICGGAFHFLNKCPVMRDTTRASARWFQLCDQLRVLTARGLTDGDPDVAMIKSTIKVMAIRLNTSRAQMGQSALTPPFN